MKHAFVRRQATPSFVFLAALLPFGCGPSEQPGGSPSESQIGSSVAVSGANDAFEQVSRFRVDARARNVLPLPAGAAIELLVENVSLEAGYLAMNGHAANSPNSRFILKGDRANLQGWVALREENLAYEYKTVNGALTVEQVPLERIYPVCNLSRPPSAASSSAVEPFLEGPSGAESFIGTYDGGDLTKLQSRPGEKKVIYLDITTDMNGDTPKDFSKEEMWKSWAGVAAGYSSFNVNVTTDPSVYAAAGVANSGIAKFISTDDRAFCAADAFGTKEYCQVFTGPGAEPEKGYGVARSATHELGHLLGLLHDGTSSEEYYTGLPAFDWAPIMGNYYSHAGNEALNQWSKGEYSGANNKEDDLAVITKTLPYRDDDVPTTKPLQITGSSVTSDVNRGQIARSSDSDTFTFKVTQSGGHATLNVARIEYIGGSMLDVDARLLDGSGTELATSNPKAQRGAKIDLALPIGDYSLVIKGGAEGTPANGFSNYSSIGYYGISGTVTGAVSGGGAGGASTGGAAGASSGGAAMGGGGSGGAVGGKGGSAGASSGGAAGGKGGSAGGGAGGKGGSAGSGGAAGSAGTSTGGSSTGGSSGTGGVSVAGAGGANGGAGGLNTSGAPTSGSGNAGASGGGGLSGSGGTSVAGAAATGGNTTGGASTVTGGAAPQGGMAASTGGVGNSTGGANVAGTAGSNAGQGPGPSGDESGCTCTTASTRNSNPSAALLLSVLAGVVTLRRRRASKAATR